MISRINQGFDRDQRYNWDPQMIWDWTRIEQDCQGWSKDRQEWSRIKTTIKSNKQEKCSLDVKLYCQKNLRFKFNSDIKLRKKNLNILNTNLFSRLENFSRKNCFKNILIYHYCRKISILSLLVFWSLVKITYNSRWVNLKNWF